MDDVSAVSSTRSSSGIAVSEETFIEPNHREKYYWREVWRFRELLGFLAWRDIVIRYKQSILGVGWSLARPALNVVVYTIVFGFFAGLPANGKPYALVVLAGFVPWQYLANTLQDVSMSVVNNTMLVGRIFFPRIILPVATLITGFVELIAAFAVLLIAMALYGEWPTWRIALAPVVLIPVVVLVLGLGIWTSALYVRFRDLRFLVPFLIQIGFFMSPVGYITDLVPARWLWLYELNPVVGAIGGFRWALLGPAFAPSAFAITTSLVIPVATVIFGVRYFRAVERDFADVI